MVYEASELWIVPQNLIIEASCVTRHEFGRTLNTSRAAMRPKSIGRRFEDAYRRRAEGEDIKMSRDLQRNFVNPETEVQKRTAGYIAQYLKEKRTEWESEVFVQKRRIAVAEEALAREGNEEGSGSRADLHEIRLGGDGLRDVRGDLRLVASRVGARVQLAADVRK